MSAHKKTPSAKLDLYAEHPDEYVTPRDPAFVRVGRAYYLAIDGRGAPGSPRFTEAINALYTVAFTVKMARKFAGTDYTVAKLEAVWWVHLPDTDFLRTPRERWRWQLMLRVPGFVTRGEVAKTIERLLERGKPASVTRVKRITLTEGRCIQVFHAGAYADEAATIERMRVFAELHRLRFRGAHHEIYLSDPHRVAPAKLRTIVRMPVGR